MYKIGYAGSFKKDYKRIKKRGYDISLLEKAIVILQETGTLPPENKPHKLEGKKYKGLWEAHLQPDWLLVWDKNEQELKLMLMYTGTHSDLF